MTNASRKGPVVTQEKWEKGWGGGKKPPPSSIYKGKPPLGQSTNRFHTEREKVQKTINFGKAKK